jgi:hypothetical protein
MAGCSGSTWGRLASSCGEISSAGGAAGGEIFFAKASGGGFAKRPAQPLTLPVGMKLPFVSSDFGNGSLGASPLTGCSVAVESPFVGVSAQEPMASVVIAAVLSPEPSRAALTGFSEVLVPFEFAWLVALPPLAPRARSMPRPRPRPSRAPLPRAARVPVAS